MSRPVDLLPACEAFLAVVDRGSFTVGAASLQVSQPVVSRRVATLERTLGGQLLQRSTRSVALTRYGRAVLPAVRRVVEATDALREQAELRRGAPLRIALPLELGTAELARFSADATAAGTDVEVLQDVPSRRAQLLADDRTDLAVLPAAADVARWRVPLGLGSREDGLPLHLESLRPGRGAGSPRLLWLLPEDDVTHVRDPLERYRDRHGLAASQLRRAGSVVAAVHRVLTRDDLVLTTRADAARCGLGWRPLAGLTLVRGRLLASSDPGRPATTDADLVELLGRLLTGPGDASEGDGRAG
ncbi:LysR family transcriptional regulator [Desertihabitans brevis]|uniref:LysR family transcriptional regulator n=1 Tax=Desertihabitans brevis TaxID=2268447 RepID=UPI0013142FB5|nr:LysR family transcriptional regulator [Desertihabitans brevis]